MGQNLNEPEQVSVVVGLSLVKADYVAVSPVLVSKVGHLSGQVCAW